MSIWVKLAIIGLVAVAVAYVVLFVAYIRWIFSPVDEEQELSHE